MRSRSLVFLIALFIIALPVVATAEDGAAVYKAKCAMCHGPDGAGQTPTGKAMKVRDLGSADIQKMTDAELKTVIESGKGKMPAYKGKIDDKTIDALIPYIRGLGVKK